MQSHLPRRGRLVSGAWFILLGLAGCIGWAWPCWGQADNDAFAHRLELAAMPTNVSPHVLNATLEPGEPDHEWLRGGTVWFSWTAPANGYLRLAGDLGGALAVLFEGNELAALHQVAPVSAGLGALYSVQAGKNFAIAVGTSSPVRGVEPAALLQLDFAAMPSNDPWAGRLPLHGETVEFQAWLAGATLEVGEPSLDPNHAYGTLWWKWVAPTSGVATLEAVSGVCWAGAYRGNSLNTLQQVAAMPHPQTPASFEVQAGVEYSVAVSGPDSDPNVVRLSLDRWMRADGISTNQTVAHPASLHFAIAGIPAGETVTNLLIYDTGELGTLVNTNQLVEVDVPVVAAGEHQIVGRASTTSGLRFTLVPLHLRVQHPNDDFATRPTLVGSPVEFVADTRGATLDPGELAAVAGSVWWSWTAPKSGLVWLTTLEGGGIGIGLFTGNAPSTLVPVEGNLVTAGQQYVIRGGPWASQPARFRLEILERPAPNDFFAQAKVLGAEDLWELVDFTAATVEPGEPVDGAGPERASLWYRFTAPADGAIEWGGSPHQQFLVPYLYPGTVYRGDTLATLTPAPSQDMFTRWLVQAGETYALRVQRTFDNSDQVAWARFHFTTTPAGDSWAGAEPLVGDHVAFRAGLDGASVEGAEPLLGSTGLAPLRTRWWSWQPSRDGWANWQVVAATPGATFWPALLEVFDGGSLSTLTPVPLTPLQWENRFFRATAGKKYFFRLADLAGESGLGSTELSFRVDLSDLEIVTPAAQERVSLPAGPTFTVRGEAMATPGVRVSYREQVGWSGSGLWTLELVEDRGEGLGAAGAWPFPNISPGTHTYYAVAVTPDGAQYPAPPVTFSVQPVPDDWANQQEIVGRHALVTNSTAGATVETGEPSLGQADASVWFRWTAPSDGTVTIKAAGENYVRAFLGADLAALQDASPGSALGATETFTAVRGETYRIVVATQSAAPPSGHQASFKLQLDETTMQWTSPPTNSVFALGQTVPLRVSTSERMADLSRLVFRAGSSVVYDGAPEPLEYLWTPLEAGTFTLSGQLQLAAGEGLTNTTRRIRVYIPNTNVVTALPVEGRQGALKADLRGSERDPDGTTASAWFKWTAPASGYFLIQTTNRTALFSAQVQYSVGTQPAQLTILKTTGSLSVNGWTTAPVTNGVTYNVRVAGSLGTLLPPLLYELLERPGNDAFADAQELAGTALTNRAITMPATVEAGEPAHANKPAARTVWYRWTAPAKGILQIGRAAAAGIYEGEAFATLTRQGTTSGTTTTATVQGGVTYRIAIGETTGNVPDVTWTLSFSPIPENDHFAQRMVLSGRRTRFTASLSLASAEAGEPQPEGFTYGHTVWFQWTAPASAAVSLHSSPAARLAVFTGSDLAQLALVSYGVWDVQFAAVAGETYQFMVDANGGGPAVTTIDLRLDEPPANDAFNSRIFLAGPHATAAGWNVGAHREYREPAHAGKPGGRSVWYGWRAAAAGPVTVQVEGDIAGTLLAVYTGNELVSLQPVTAAEGTTSASGSFEAAAGQDYVIAVDGQMGAGGDFLLKLDQTAPPDPPQLRWSGPGRLRVEGLAGRAGRVEISADLVGWTHGPAVPSGMQAFEWIEESQDAARFYRVRLEP